MAAAVVEDVNLAVGVTGHDDRLDADPGAHEVARRRHLRGMADIDPAAREDPLHFQIEDRLVLENLAVDPGIRDQPGQIAVRQHVALRMSARRDLAASAGTVQPRYGG